MDWKTFIAEIVKALAWPSAVLVLLLIFREPVSAILRKLTRLRYKDLEADFGKVIVEETRKADEAGLSPPTVEPERLVAPLLGSEYLLRIAEVVPRAAVMEAWARLESALQATAVRLGMDTRDSAGRVVVMPQQLRRLAASLGERGFALASNIDALRQLRNQVAHHPQVELSVSEAEDYVRLALRAVKALDELQPPAAR